jgi:hypothetical protein
MVGNHCDLKQVNEGKTDHGVSWLEIIVRHHVLPLQGDSLLEVLAWCVLRPCNSMTNTLNSISLVRSSFLSAILTQ